MWDLIVSVPDHCLSLYFDYEHLHLKLMLLKHFGQGKLCRVSGGSRNIGQEEYVP